MGLGEQGIIKIPVTREFDLDISLLDSYFQKAREAGIQIFAVVGSAPTTATGIYDNLEALADFCEQHQLWFHVDGAHGGAAVFSSKYRHILKGISRADSVVIDGHKMMMMPTITTALLFKDRNHSHTTFSQRADYLLVQSEDEDWYNLAKRTFECTKTMMSIQWYTLLKLYGEELFDQYVTTLFDLGYQFAELIKADPHFELAVTPMSNIVCFRYVDNSLDVPGLNKINQSIRRQIIEEGEFYIVQTTLRDIHYLRTTIMNPFTTIQHLSQLLKRISEKANHLLTSQ
jgi:L-2,4-diaminobutyrate decarboxylase